jgi:hypothetical protein
MTKIAGSGSESGSISQRHGFADPDPHQSVMDPEHLAFVSLPYKIPVISNYQIPFSQNKQDTISLPLVNRTLGMLSKFIQVCFNGYGTVPVDKEGK